MKVVSFLAIVLIFIVMPAKSDELKTGVQKENNRPSKITNTASEKSDIQALTEKELIAICTHKNHQRMPTNYHDTL